MIFQCRNCGGNVIYSPEKKGMYCPFCDSEKSEQRKDSEGDIRICPNCGGEVPAEEFTSASQCPYCDNYIIFNERVEGKYLPEYVIPFRHSKNMVKKLMREKFAKCTFAPTDFLAEARLDTMEGDYVPFWLHDYDVNYTYRGEGRKTRMWTTGEIQYTETSVYSIVRDVNVSFEKVPADASIKMPDEIMDLMEPYEYSGLESFRPEYLSGFSAERYNYAAEEMQVRSRQKMEEDTVSLVRQSIAGYGSISDSEKSLKVNGLRAHYGLLPVWKYGYQYKSKDYPFYINGQTAKIVGKVPVSSAKVWAYGATLFGVLTGILLFAYYGFMML